MNAKTKKIIAFSFVALVALVIIVYFINKQNAKKAAEDLGGTGNTGTGTNTGTLTEKQQRQAEFAGRTAESIIQELVGRINEAPEWYNMILTTKPASLSMEQALRDNALYLMWEWGLPQWNKDLK